MGSGTPLSGTGGRALTAKRPSGATRRQASSKTTTRTAPRLAGMGRGALDGGPLPPAEAPLREPFVEDEAESLLDPVVGALVEGRGVPAAGGPGLAEPRREGMAREEGPAGLVAAVRVAEAEGGARGGHPLAAEEEPPPRPPPGPRPP